jgi:deaminated glutathione amidase
MFKIASLQTVASGDLQHNLSVAQRLLTQAADQGCNMAVLPEYFCLFGQHDRDKLKIQEKFGAGPIQEKFANLARTYRMFIVAGTIPISTDDPNRVLNSTLVFSPSGSVVCKYDKIHLFSFSSGGESYDESKTLKAGNSVQTFDVEHQNETWRFGLSICYDLRFPEMFRAMGEVDCHLLPAAFTYTTGKVHWEILLRARAIENQCYVVASAQGGEHENGRQTWGHSMVINPWGQIQSYLESGEGIVVGELNHSEIADIRQKLPALKHRTHF